MISRFRFYISTDKKRWINDLDEDLISVYTSLQKDYLKFINKCKQIKTNLKQKFEEIIKDKNYEKDIKFYFINRTVWGGRVNYNIPSRLYFSNPSGWNIINSDRLKDASTILQNTKITNSSYENVLFEDGENVLIYIDPPYYINTKLSKTSRLYKHNFEIEDHKKLCEDIKKTKHKIVLSYDDNQFIRKLYKDFNLGLGLGKKHSRAESWKYCGTSGAIKTKKTGKELIITNF